MLDKEETERLKKLKDEIIETTDQTKNLSPKEQFAEWAKKKRKLKTLVAEHSKEFKKTEAKRKKIETSVKWYIRLLKYSSIIGIILIGRKHSPLFMIPPGLVGPKVKGIFQYIPIFKVYEVGPITWLIACNTVISYVI